jgi:hypothetical protein
MTARAISLVAERLYYSLVNSVELAISRIVVKLRRQQWRRS